MPKLIFVTFVSAVVFGVVLLAVEAGGHWVVFMDGAALRLALVVRSPALTVAMKSATVLGTGLVYVVVLAAGWPLVRRRLFKPVMVAVTSLAAAQLVRVGVNLLVQRPRPPHNVWLVAANMYSFPSGHTATAAVGLGLAAWLVWTWDRRAGRVAAVAAVAGCLLVAASRVYLGVHWLSDVLASMLFAISWIGLTLLTARRIVDA